MSKTKGGTVKETGAIVSRRLIGIEARNKNMIVEVYKTRRRDEEAAFWENLRSLMPEMVIIPER